MPATRFDDAKSGENLQSGYLSNGRAPIVDAQES